MPCVFGISLMVVSYHLSDAAVSKPLELKGHGLDEFPFHFFQIFFYHPLLSHLSETKKFAS